MKTRIKASIAAIVVMAIMACVGSVFHTTTAQAQAAPTTCISCPAPLPTSEAAGTPIELP